mgnify:CR=1 FL=1
MDLEEQYDKIYRYCYFKTHSRETAEDITQEAFLRFFESRSYTDRGSALQYLYTIARNLCTDEYRRAKPCLLDEESLGSYSDAEMLMRSSLKDALDRMDEEDRELLLLRYVNELPVKVIAGLYGISRFALHRRLSKAVKDLKDRLGEEDPP